MAQYPYATSSDPTEDGLLTRPRFSTRRYDALFVRIEAVYADNVKVPLSRSPVGIFADALDSESKSNKGHIYLWDQIKAAATSGSDGKPLPAVLSDDTINLLSLISTDPKEQVLLGIGASGAATTIVSPLSPVTETPLSPTLSPTANGNGVPIPTPKTTLPSSTPQSPKDWAEFSSAGFGETTFSQDFAATLLDKDVEVTEPPVQRKASNSKRKQSRNVTPVEPTPPVPEPRAGPEEPAGPKLLLVTAEIVQLDEAFIDFWRDAAVDPISNDWPKFVVGELKNPLNPRSITTSSEDGEKAASGSSINWVIIEEKFRKLTPPPSPVVPHEALATSGGLRVPAAPLKRTSSPRPSFGEKKSSSLSATLKRFTLFGSSKDDLTSDDTNPTAGGSGKKDSISGKRMFGVGKSPKVGEMGEGVLSEEPEPLPEVTKKVEGEIAALAAGVVGGAVLAGAAGSDRAHQDDSPAKEPVPAPPVTSATEHEVPAPIAEESIQVPDTVEGSNASVLKSPTPEAAEEPEQPVAGTEPDTLPPAPESVVSHGETPGPQLALDSTEAGLHHAPDVEESQDPTTESPNAPPPEPVIEHLEDKVEDSAADVGVELDPVPIVPNDPAEVDEAEEPEVVPEPELEPAVVESTPEASVSEQETGSEPSSRQPTAEDEVVEEPQPVAPEDPSPLPPNVPASEDPEEEVETTVIPEDIPAVQSALEGLH